MKIIGLSLYWESKAQPSLQPSWPHDVSWKWTQYCPLRPSLMQKWRLLSNLLILPGPVCEISPTIWGRSTFPVAVTMTTRHKRSLSSLFLGFSLMFLSLMKHQLTYQGLPVVLSPFVVSNVLYLSFTHPADTERRLLFIWSLTFWSLWTPEGNLWIISCQMFKLAAAAAFKNTVSALWTLSEKPL